MTKIGALCLLTIGGWVIIELAVQFAPSSYNHDCVGGEGEEGFIPSISTEYSLQNMLLKYIIFFKGGCLLPLLSGT